MRGFLVILTMFAASLAAYAEETATTDASAPEPSVSVMLVVTMDKYAQAFKKADANGDGYVTRDEAKAAGLQWPCFTNSDLWNAADADGDGKLSFDEAVAEKRVETDRVGQQLAQCANRIKHRLASPNMSGHERDQWGKILAVITSGLFTVEGAESVIPKEQAICDIEKQVDAGRAVSAEARTLMNSKLDEAVAAIAVDWRESEGPRVLSPPPPAPPTAGQGNSTTANSASGRATGSGTAGNPPPPPPPPDGPPHATRPPAGTR